MKLYDWITAHPDDHLRVIRYEPAPDIMDEHGNLVCGGEGTGTVVFDSTTGNGDLESLLLVDIINSIDDEGPDENGVYELEYMPDEYWC